MGSVESLKYRQAIIRLLSITSSQKEFLNKYFKIFFKWYNFSFTLGNLVCEDGKNPVLTEDEGAFTYYCSGATLLQVHTAAVAMVTIVNVMAMVLLFE